MGCTVTVKIKRSYIEVAEPIKTAMAYVARALRLLVTIFNTHVKDGVTKKYMYYVWSPV